MVALFWLQSLREQPSGGDPAFATILRLRRSYNFALGVCKPPNVGLRTLRASLSASPNPKVARISNLIPAAFRYEKQA